MPKTVRKRSFAKPAMKPEGAVLGQDLAARRAPGRRMHPHWLLLPADLCASARQRLTASCSELTKAVPPAIP